MGPGARTGVTTTPVTSPTTASFRFLDDVAVGRGPCRVAGDRVTCPRPACKGAVVDVPEVDSPRRRAVSKEGDSVPKGPREGAEPVRQSGRGSEIITLPPAVVARPGDVIALAPNVLSVRHWDRLLGGVLYAATPRVEWAALLRRTFDVDVMQCPKCGGRLRVLGVITEHEPVRRILVHLGLATDVTPPARARDPTDEVDDDVEPAGQLELGLA